MEAVGGIFSKVSDRVQEIININPLGTFSEETRALLNNLTPENMGFGRTYGNVAEKVREVVTGLEVGGGLGDVRDVAKGVKKAIDVLTPNRFAQIGPLRIPIWLEPFNLPDWMLR